MKNTKWIWRVLAVLLSLVVLAGVGFAGFRIGVMQGANLTGTELLFHKQAFDLPHRFDGDSQRGHGFDSGGFHQGRADFGGRGRFSFFSPIFGLVRLAVLAGLIWLGYSFVKRSGWRVVNVNASQPAAPAPAAPASEPEIEEKKDEA
ncbi:MAG: hypothetical protein JNK32_07770 [Anaerolineales bacterium]|nr:hypothetical protein [Anaerolineales bacterium]